MSAILLLFIFFLLLPRKIKTNTHPLGLSTLTKLLNKFHEYFCVAKKAVTQTIITPDIYILSNFGFLMVPKTVKFTSRNGIKTHSEMGKERGEKVHPILVALVQSYLTSVTPIGFCPGNGMEVGPISAPEGPGSPALPEQ